ncbi:MAG: type III polyketide synthase [Planctomycetota bacterium]|jgi:predicted naringenin-chalcone synthase
MSIDFVTEPSQKSAPSRVRARITEYATVIPEETILQSDAAHLAQGLGVSKRWNRMLPALYRKSGVHRRSSVLLGPPHDDVFSRQSFYGIASESEAFGPTTAQRMQAYQKHAGPLLHRAGHRVLDRIAEGTDSITHLVTVSCTGFCAPGIDYQLIESLGLSPEVQRTHVGFMGCHGLINGIRVATALVESNPRARVLVGAVELCSLHQQYSEDSDQLVASALFSDGAACLLLESERTEDTSPSEGWEIVSSLSRKLDQTSDLMSWNIGNHGFQMTLSPRIPSVIEAQLRQPLSEWLAEEQLGLSDIGAWAVHPGGPRVIDAAGQALGLEDSRLQASRDILSEFGNMSSPTVLFILERLHPTSSPGSHAVMLAFGPGLQVEALLLRRV